MIGMLIVIGILSILGLVILIDRSEKAPKFLKKIARSILDFFYAFYYLW